MRFIAEVSEVSKLKDRFDSKAEAADSQSGKAGQMNKKFILR